MINTEGFFYDIYKNARENSVIVMDVKGKILQASKSFTAAFGYTNKDLVQKHFRMLFTANDKKIKKPENEVKLALAKGSHSDNNYLVHKNGTPVWVMGESLAVTNTDKEKFLVKIIHNIHAQKQLEQYLVNSSDFIDKIFDSILDTAIILLDSELKIIKCNKAFIKIFGLSAIPAEGSRISHIENVFWKTPELRQQLLDIIVKQKNLKNALYTFKTKEKKEKNIAIDSKLIYTDGNEKRILLVIKNMEV